MTVDDLVANFAKALRRLLPAVNRLGIPWKRPDAYDEWDSLAAATFDTLMVAPLKWSIPEAEQERFRLPEYDLLLETYAGYSLIEIDAGSDPGCIRVFHSLETKDEPFDTVGWRPVDPQGQPLRPSFETSPRRAVTMTLRHLRADGSVRCVDTVQAPAESAGPSPSTPLRHLDLNHRLIRDIHGLATKTQDHFQKFILEWIILNHFFIASWEYDHGRVDEPGDRKAFKAFSRHQDVEAVRATILGTTVGDLRVVGPVTRRGDEVLAGARQVKAKDLSPDQFWDVLYAIRNNVIHGSKPPSGESNEANIQFASSQLMSIVTELARIAGIDLGQH